MMAKPEGISILIVDDDADIRRFICRVLGLEGYQLFQAARGDEGLKILREKQVSLVILDLRLPDRDGLSVLTEIKDDRQLKNIPVIILTASAGKEKQQRAVSLGTAAYLVKPVSVTELLEGMKKALRGRRRGNKLRR